MRANRLPLVSTGPATAPSLGNRAGGGAGSLLRGGVEQLVARRAHNPEVAGSSPAPASILSTRSAAPAPEQGGRGSGAWVPAHCAVAVAPQHIGYAHRCELNSMRGSRRFVFDQPVAVLRGHEGIMSRRERRGGGRVIYLHTDAAAPATVTHAPRRWLDEGLPLRPTSLHTRALRPQLSFFPFSRPQARNAGAVGGARASSSRRPA